MNISTYDNLVETDIKNNAKSDVIVISKLLGNIDLLKINTELSIKDTVYDEYKTIVYTNPITINAQVDLNPKTEILTNTGLRLLQDIIIRIPTKILGELNLTVEIDDVIRFRNVDYFVNEIGNEGFFKNDWCELIIGAVQC